MPNNGDITERGRADIAALTNAAMGWAGLNVPRAASSGRVSKATLERVKRQEPVSEAMLRAVGEILSLPRDFLLYVGYRDLDAVVRASANDPDLMRWTVELMLSEGDDEECRINVRQLHPTTRATLKALGYA